MTRSIKDDYGELLKFINDYTLKNAYKDEELNEIIKPLHKGYFSILVLMAELDHQKVKPILTCPKAHHDSQQKLFWLYLAESISELGGAFFLILNGCYKATEQVLRSSIENFVKALGGLYVLGLNNQKNVFEVFEKASSTGFFATDFGKNIHQKLSELYGILCCTVHTGSEQNMQSISALGDFPAIDTKKAIFVKEKYLKIIKLYVSSISILFQNCFHKMHHNNRDIVQLSLSAAAITELHNKK